MNLATKTGRSPACQKPISPHGKFVAGFVRLSLPFSQTGSGGSYHGRKYQAIFDFVAGRGADG